jgi:hypothetical protein
MEKEGRYDQEMTELTLSSNELAHPKNATRLYYQMVKFGFILLNMESTDTVLIR